MKTLPLFLVCLVLLFGCKETDTRPKCPSVEHAPQEFLDYWFFPKGSWPATAYYGYGQNRL